MEDVVNRDALPVTDKCDICRKSCERSALFNCGRGLDDPFFACNDCLNPKEEDEDDDSEDDIDDRSTARSRSDPSSLDCARYYNCKCDHCEQICDVTYGLGCPPGWPRGGDVLAYCIQCFNENTKR